MCESRYRLEYSPDVAVQLAEARRDFPKEIAWLLAEAITLAWGAVEDDELRNRGRLAWSDEDQTDYLYQHVNPGRVCLSVMIDDNEMAIRILRVVQINYCTYLPGGKMMKRS